MDGWITIGTKLSTDKFDKQIADLEKKMKREEDKKIVIGAKLESQQKELETARQKVDELAEAYERMKKAQDAIEKGVATPTQFTDFFGMQDTYGSLEDLGNTFDKALTKQEGIEQRVEGTKLQYQGVVDKVQEYKDKIETTKFNKQTEEVKKMKDDFGNTNNTLGTIINKVSRLTLGIFGIRSAYFAVRQAVSTLSEYNGQLAGQIQAIKLSLVSIIEPVVNFIVKTIGKAVAFIGYILKQLFGINIFSNATAMAFDKMKKSASGASKAIKEIKKQLTGFDEANVLSETGTTGGVGNLSSAVADFKNTKTALAELEREGETVATNLRKWFLGSDKTDFKEIWEDNLKIIKEFLKNVQLVFKPIVEWIKKYVWDPIKANFKTAVQAMAPVLNPLKSAFKTVVDTFKSYWTSFKKFFNDKIITPIKNAFKGIGTSLYNAVVPYINKVIKAVNVILKPFGKEIKEISVKTTKSSGGGFRAKGGVFYPSLLPKLALGGIINQPGRGALYNGAVIGERGAEAVVPLTDTQQMEFLGRTIGKYITINANIVNSMNGRVISRELKQIQNEQDFAYNT